VVASVTVPATPSHAASTTWSARADQALKAAEPYSGNEPFTNAYLARARATRFGWNDPMAKVYLGRVLAEQRTDGGWGTLHDGFAKSHAVSTAEHVGPMLIEAWKAGRVTTVRMSKVADFLLGLPRTKVELGSYDGAFVAPNSVDKGPWIHNISQAVGLYLKEFRAASGGQYRAKDIDHAVTLITRAEVATYNSQWRSWTYREDVPKVLNDADHNALSVHAMLKLWAPTGVHAKAYLDKPPYPNWGPSTAPLAFVRLNHQRGPAEFDKFYAAVPGSGMSAQVKTTRYAQLACFAALNWRAS
jgi:hypothetical protein